jgi:hypothetical protein
LHQVRLTIRRFQGKFHVQRLPVEARQRELIEQSGGLGEGDKTLQGHPLERAADSLQAVIRTDQGVFLIQDGYQESGSIQEQVSKLPVKVDDRLGWCISSRLAGLQTASPRFQSPLGFSAPEYQ